MLLFLISFLFLEPKHSKHSAGRDAEPHFRHCNVCSEGLDFIVVPWRVSARRRGWGGVWVLGRISHGFQVKLLCFLPSSSFSGFDVFPLTASYVGVGGWPPMVSWADSSSRTGGRINCSKISLMWLVASLWLVFPLSLSSLFFLCFQVVEVVEAEYISCRPKVWNEIFENGNTLPLGTVVQCWQNNSLLVDVLNQG